MTDHEATNEPADEIVIVSSTAVGASAANGRDKPTLAQLEAALLTLRRLDRELFLAHRLDNMSYRQMAEITGLSMRQIQRRMARAMGDFDRALRGEVPRRRRWWWPF